jgi:hypothetical protein
MPMTSHSFSIPYPGFVDICFDGMDPMRFSEQSVRDAIANVKARKDTFATEAAYLAVLHIYEQALCLLEEKK